MSRVVSRGNPLMKSIKKEIRDERTFGLPYKQRRLVALYDGNNLNYISKVVGVSVSTLKKWLNDDRVVDAIQLRDEIVDSPVVASRVERKEFWTHVMLHEGIDVKDRLKASELLGKSECDFSETRVLKGAGSGTTVIVNTGVPRAPGDPAVEVRKDDDAVILSDEEMEQATVITDSVVLEDMF